MPVNVSVEHIITFFDSPPYDNTRGINRTDWIRIDRTTYDNCRDPRDYRPRGSR